MNHYKCWERAWSKRDKLSPEIAELAAEQLAQSVSGPRQGKPCRIRIRGKDYILPSQAELARLLVVLTNMPRTWQFRDIQNQRDFNRACRSMQMYLSCYKSGTGPLWLREAHSKYRFTTSL